MQFVLFRGESLCHVDSPVYGEGRVVEADAALRLFAVEIVALISEDRRLGQHGKAVGKAARNHELTVVFRRKLHGHMPSVGGRAAAKIHGHVQHRAFEHAHQLGLGVFAFLKMQSAHRAVAGFRLIILHEVVEKPGSLKSGLAVAFKKVAALVGKDARLDDEDASKGRFNKVHGVPRTLSDNTRGTRPFS